MKKHLTSRATDLKHAYQALAKATALAAQLDAEAQEALARRDPESYRTKSAQARQAWATKRQLASLVRASGTPAKGQMEQTIGEFAWSRRPL